MSCAVRRRVGVWRQLTGGSQHGHGRSVGASLRSPTSGRSRLLCFSDWESARGPSIYGKTRATPLRHPSPPRRSSAERPRRSRSVWSRFQSGLATRGAPVGRQGRPHTALGRSGRFTFACCPSRCAFATATATVGVCHSPHLHPLPPPLARRNAGPLAKRVAERSLRRIPRLLRGLRERRTLPQQRSGLLHTQPR